MPAEYTELEWDYTPSNFFEKTFEVADDPRYSLRIAGGKAVARLSEPMDLPELALEDEIHVRIENTMRVRQLQTFPSAYNLSKVATIRQRTATGTNVAPRVTTDALLITSGRPDLLITDANGNVVRDTRAERIANDAERLRAIGAKAGRSDVLRDLLESFSRSVADPAKALAHLYDIRDALVRPFGSAAAARQALGISRRDWTKLGKAANTELEQGRHRGKYATRQPASEAEIRVLQEMVRQWIYAFEKDVP